MSPASRLCENPGAAGLCDPIAQTTRCSSHSTLSREVSVHGKPCKASLSARPPQRKQASVRPECIPRSVPPVQVSEFEAASENRDASGHM